VSLDGDYESELELKGLGLDYSGEFQCPQRIPNRWPVQWKET